MGDGLLQADWTTVDKAIDLGIGLCVLIVCVAWFRQLLADTDDRGC